MVTPHHFAAMPDIKLAAKRQKSYQLDASTVSRDAAPVDPTRITPRQKAANRKKMMSNIGEAFTRVIVGALALSLIAFWIFLITQPNPDFPLGSLSGVILPTVFVGTGYALTGDRFFKFMRNLHLKGRK